jgi:hypothetical protein
MTTMSKKLPLTCSICAQPIVPHPLTGWAYGNNAEPLNDGRCCDDCDAMHVIPERIRLIYAQRPQLQPKKGT